MSWPTIRKKFNALVGSTMEGAVVAKEAILWYWFKNEKEEEMENKLRDKRSRRRREKEEIFGKSSNEKVQGSKKLVCIDKE